MTDLDAPDTMSRSLGYILGRIQCERAYALNVAVRALGNRLRPRRVLEVNAKGMRRPVESEKASQRGPAGLLLSLVDWYYMKQSELRLCLLQT